MVVDLLSVVKLTKDLKESAEFIIELPQRLVSSLLGTNIEFRSRYERIEAYKEIGELREIAKILQQMYMSKGGLLQSTRSTALKTVKDVCVVKNELSYVIGLFEELEDIFQKVSFSNTSLATEAILHIAQAKKAFRLLFKIKDQDFLEKDTLYEVSKCLVCMVDSANQLIKKLDEHRQSLDFCYG